MSRAARHDNRAGFTLIELLTVIAIIAILTAIIFPVFASVRENARQATSLSNMHLISTRLEQYKLDNHKYPDVLFGYVYREYSTNAIVPMDQALAQAQAQGAAVASQYFPGLYPEYINDVNAFTDPNNPTKSMAVDTGNLPVNTLTTGGTLAAGTQDFYAADAYDASPLITGTNKISSGSTPTYVVRYQTSWTDINNSLDCTVTKGSAANSPLCTEDGSGNASGGDDYLRQLRWQNPPSNTYVTSTTYHVPNDNFVLVLWQGGAARKLDAQTQFLNTGPGGAEQNDTQNVTASGNPGISQASFWRVPQNGP